MNEKIRNFFIGFITAIAAACGAVLYYFRKSANTVGDNDRQSAELTERMGREIKELGERSRESESDYSAAKQTIAEIKKNQKITTDNNSSSI